MTETTVRKGQMGLVIKLLPYIVAILLMVGVLGYVFLVHFGGWDMILGWVSGAGSGLLGALGEVPWPDVDIGGSITPDFGPDESDAPDEVIEEFETFVSDINELCREYDGDGSGALGTYDFQEIDTIALAEDPRPSRWYTNTFTANGDGWEIQREAEDCDAAVWCEDIFHDVLPFGLSADVCVGWYSPPGPSSFEEGQGIRYEIEDGDSIALERDDVDEDELDPEDIEDDFDVQECGTNGMCMNADNGDCPGGSTPDADGDGDCDDGTVCCRLDPRIQ